LIPLHNHTNYSRLDGLSKPKDIASRAVELGLEAIGITDHDLVAGHIDFYNTMVEHGVKPILGIEAYQAPYTRFTHEKTQSDKTTKKRLDNFHLILLAKTNQGLKNLWGLNTESHRSGFWHHGRVDWELLEKYKEGLICTTSCAAGLIPQGLLHEDDIDTFINKFLGIFGDDFYLELGTYTEAFQVEINQKLSRLAYERSLPVVYGNDAHYARIDDYDLHEATLAVQYNHKLDERASSYHHPCLYIMDEETVRDYLSYLEPSVVDEAIANTDLIGSQVDVKLPESRNRTPVFIPDKEWNSSWDMFFELIKKGFDTKVNGENKEIYVDRLKKEIEVITEAHLYDYFLIVRDYVVWAKNNGIMVGPGRA